MTCVQPSCFSHFSVEIWQSGKFSESFGNHLYCRGPRGVSAWLGICAAASNESLKVSRRVIAALSHFVCANKTLDTHRQRANNSRHWGVLDMCMNRLPRLASIG